MFLNKIVSYFKKSTTQGMVEFKIIFEKFRQLLEENNQVLEIIGELEEQYSGEYIFDINFLKKSVSNLSEKLIRIISDLNIISENRYPELFNIQRDLQHKLTSLIEQQDSEFKNQQAVPFDDLDRDDDELVGGKSANLGEIKNHIHFRTPNGFAITVSAYQNFMKFNDFFSKIKRILLREPALAAEEADKKIDNLFETAKYPPDLKREIEHCMKNCMKKVKRGTRLAVRSSGVGEDVLTKSYAGQFRSILNVSHKDVFASYKKIIASRFKRLPYQSGYDLKNLETNLQMAVTIQEMIPVKVSGVAYSLDPTGQSFDSLIISSIYGLGLPIVSGTLNSDFFRVSRINPSEILEKRITKKEKQVIAALDGGIKTVPVPKNLQDSPSLNDEQIKRIAEITFVLDRSFQKPQDIEWTIDVNDQLVVLQSRPLLIDTKNQKRVVLPKSLPENPVLFEKKGFIANRGIAAGKVCLISDEFDPAAFPVGAIAVTKQTSPRLSTIIRKTSAIITDIGSSTGHMATIAREFGVPAIVGTIIATQTLKDGMDITVDAEENIIYDGIVEDLIEYQMEGEDIFVDMPEYKILRRLLKKISPLYLIDPGSKNFEAKNCRTYHDIIRFSHEKAMLELINLNISSKRFPEISLKELKLSIPLGLKIIDIGSGISQQKSDSKHVTPGEINSFPMRAVLEGLNTPNVWSTEPVELDFGGFMSSITRFNMSDDRLVYQGQNVAVISDKYLNLSLRLGYHFNVIDAYVSENVNDNYIYFRFVGGVTESERRHRRALVIQAILARSDFKVTVTGDLIVGKVKKKTAEEMKTTLVQMGKLIGFSRQLDAKMNSEAAIQYYIDSFFKAG